MYNSSPALYGQFGKILVPKPTTPVSQLEVGQKI